MSPTDADWDGGKPTGLKSREAAGTSGSPNAKYRHRLDPAADIITERSGVPISGTPYASRTCRASTSGASPCSPKRTYIASPTSGSTAPCSTRARAPSSASAPPGCGVRRARALK